MTGWFSGLSKSRINENLPPGQLLLYCIVLEFSEHIEIIYPIRDLNIEMDQEVRHFLCLEKVPTIPLDTLISCKLVYFEN